MAISIGISKERFDDSTPNDLQYDFKAYELKRKRMDEDMWRNGIYTMSAVSTAVSRALNGRKSRAKYVDEPMLEGKNLTDSGDPDENMTEDEIKKAREQLLMKLQVMQTNFELNHSNEKEGVQE